MSYMPSSGMNDWLVDWQKMPAAKNSYASGGLVRGKPGLDKVEVESLEPGGSKVNYSEGEYVIPRDVVQALGRSTFDSILEAFHSPVLGETK